VGDISIWQPYGWCGRLFFAGVTGPEFGKLEDAESRNRWLHLHGDDGGYNYRQETVHIRVHDDSVWQYVRRGALWQPKLAAELAKNLEAKLRSVIR